jgi:hypothetical protein
MIAIRINDALAQLQTVSEVAIRDAGPVDGRSPLLRCRAMETVSVAEYKIADVRPLFGKGRA